MGNYFTDPVFLSMLDAPPEKDLKQHVKKLYQKGTIWVFPGKTSNLLNKKHHYLF